MKPRAEGMALPVAASQLRVLLKSMGVDAYEPRVLHQLLEFQQQYCEEILTAGQDYAEHAGRNGELECEDVQLAARLRESARQTTAPKMMEWMAKDRNSRSIPAPRTYEIQAPPQKLCLVEENWQLLPLVSESRAVPTHSVPRTAPSARARRISINLGHATGDPLQTNLPSGDQMSD